MWDFPNTIRRTTSFHTEHADDGVDEPDGGADARGRCFRRRWAATPVLYTGGTVASVTGQTQIQFTAPHGLSPGQAITSGTDMRFVAAVENSTTVFINAPFTTTPTAGAAIGATMTYKLAEDLPSVSIFDYWDPSGAVQRIVNGAAMDKLTIKVNGDFQEFDFAGPSQDLLDSASFTSGAGRAERVSGGAGADGIRLHDHSGEPGAGLDGSDAERILYADRGGADARKQHRATAA